MTNMILVEEMEHRAEFAGLAKGVDQSQVHGEEASFSVFVYGLPF